MSRVKHNLSGHRFYNRWAMIMNRCFNKEYIKYQYYGARGISVSEEFKNPAIFLKYLDELEGFGIDGRTEIDRIENNGNYERGNIKWSNRKEQQNNRRIHKHNTSGFPGVSYVQRQKRWVASVYIKNRQKYIGCAESAEKAAELRNNYITKTK